MKFRVIDKLTGKEADTYEIALHEEWAKELCYCDMDGFAILEDGTLLLVDECGKFEYCDTDRFEIVFDDERPHEKLKKAHYIKGENGEWYCSSCKRIDDKYSVARYCWWCGAEICERK